MAKCIIVVPCYNEAKLATTLYAKELAEILQRSLGAS